MRVNKHILFSNGLLPMDTPVLTDQPKLTFIRTMRTLNVF